MNVEVSGPGTHPQINAFGNPDQPDSLRHLVRVSEVEGEQHRVEITADITLDEAKKVIRDMATMLLDGGFHMPDNVLDMDPYSLGHHVATQRAISRQRLGLPIERGAK